MDEDIVSDYFTYMTSRSMKDTASSGDPTRDAPPGASPHIPSRDGEHSLLFA